MTCDFDVGFDEIFSEDSLQLSARDGRRQPSYFFCVVGIPKLSRELGEVFGVRKLDQFFFLNKLASFRSDLGQDT